MNSISSIRIETSFKCLCLEHICGSMMKMGIHSEITKLEAAPFLILLSKA